MTNQAFSPQHARPSGSSGFIKPAYGIIVVLLLAMAGTLLWLMRTQPQPGEALATAPAEKSVITPPDIPYADITDTAGIDFVHTNGATGDRWLPETMGGGVAFFDYDNDGDQDLLLINSRHWQTADKQPVMGLYRNTGQGTFENVTQGSGLDVSLYGMGCAVGDFDNDGWVDVFISALGSNRLFRNVQGHFSDVTTEAGTAGSATAWSTGSAFIDYNNDAYLDLFVANYVQWSEQIDKEVDFRFAGLGRAYGPPVAYQGSQPYLYRNNGDGSFTDVSASIGITVKHPDTALPVAKSLAVAPVDVDQDSWIDLMVANDTVRNFMFHNKNGTHFEEIGASYGVAYDNDGKATGAMGVDAAYFRNSEELGIIVGNFANEMSSLYISQTDATQFADAAMITGIGPASRLALTFAAFFYDADLDGRLDLFQANGHIEAEINKLHASQQYRQPAQLFWNCGSSCASDFLEIPDTGAMQTPLVGRGAAYADIDADGDLDVIITQPGLPPLLLRNDQTSGHHWLRVKLIGKTVNRDAIGAWLELTAGGIQQKRQVMPSRGYLSQVELPVTFGLGQMQHIDSLSIYWPDGTTQTLQPEVIDTTLVISQP